MPYIMEVVEVNLLSAAYLLYHLTAAVRVVAPEIASLGVEKLVYRQIDTKHIDI